MVFSIHEDVVMGLYDGTNQSTQQEECMKKKQVYTSHSHIDSTMLDNCTLRRKQGLKGEYKRENFETSEEVHSKILHCNRL